MHALINLWRSAGRFLSSFTWNIRSLGWLKVWWVQELLSRRKWSVWCASPPSDLTAATALPLWRLLQFTGLMLSWEPLQGMLKVCFAVLGWPNKIVVGNLMLKKKKQTRREHAHERDALLTPSLCGLKSRRCRGLVWCDPPASTPLSFSAAFTGIWDTWPWFLHRGAFCLVQISCRLCSVSGMH